MKAQELKTKSMDELNKQLTELRKEAFNLRFEHASGELKNTSLLRKNRIKIAMLKTTITENKEQKNA